MKLCIDCGKQLSKNRCTRCNHCSNINKWKNPKLREQVRQKLLGYPKSKETRKRLSIANKGKPKPHTANYVSRAVSLDLVMVENSPYHRGHLKARLLKSGALKNECYECGLKPVWNGKTLVFVLDHKNGVKNDHRIENLRLLCPNCNSQTPTFSGRNVKKK